MNKQFNLYSCGTKVWLGIERNIVGEIAAISIRFENVVYEVVWWEGANRRSEFINSSEFSVDQPEMTKIGFTQ